jgi:hypothetical protein
MMKRAIAAVAAIAGIGMLSGCGGLRAYAAHDPLPDPSATPKAVSSSPPKTAPPASRCTSVGKAEQKALNALLTSGVKGTKFAAVRSEDFDQVYMVAVRLAGNGVGTNYNAVFATDALNGKGQTFAVDGFAQEYSSLGEATQQGVTPDADGVSEAQACVARSASTGDANLPG